MSEDRRTPLLKMEMFVDEHETKEYANPDKPDAFKVTLKAPKKSLKIGMEDAQARLQIKALDDIVKVNFPKYGSFEILVYPLKKKAKIERKETVPTTLTE